MGAGEEKKAGTKFIRRGASFTDRILLTMVPLTPLRSPRVRRATRTARRRWSASRRNRSERRGDFSRSRPALFDLDEKLGSFLPASGFFLEAGAYDGFHASNTYFLERARGWSGLLVEAVPELYEWTRRERPRSKVVNSALVPPELAGRRLSVHYAGTMSIVSGARGDEDEDADWLESAMLFDDGYEVEVVGRTMSELIDAAGAPTIDFLSLDIEGYEEQALLGLDLERHAPRWALIEVHTPDHLAAVSAIFGDRYRSHGYLTQQDVLFERRD